ncbi:hypothetical protein CAEBREN_13680 [Caenorhabditis brenneri]|uniref:Uncharacterized protein n=1 Tax=Caenorhabditis brenneri TaxID=135651 RepID=G0MJR2_CAEBE|nr:hypothetical protein CAEBREN_13680 [Caenorhabditis brenneri]
MTSLVVFICYLHSISIIFMPMGFIPPPRRNCGENCPPTDPGRVIIETLCILIGCFLLVFICRCLARFLSDCCMQKYGKKQKNQSMNMPMIERPTPRIDPTENWTSKFCFDVEQYVTTLERNGQIIHEQLDEELMEFVRNPCEKCSEINNETQPPRYSTLFSNDSSNS